MSSLSLLVSLWNWLTRGRSKMPVVTGTGKPVHYDLKTVPPVTDESGNVVEEGGYVEIKVMTWGEKLDRRNFNSKMEVKTTRGSKDATSLVDIFKKEMELYDFAHCIVEHNLQAEDGRPLDFRNPKDVQAVWGVVGEEIATYIDKVNNFEEQDETKNSSGASAPTS